MDITQDHIYFILNNIENDPSKECTTRDTFQSWLSLEPRSESECRDFVAAEKRLLEDSLIEEKDVIGEGMVTYKKVRHLSLKGHELLDKLKNRYQ